PISQQPGAAPLDVLERTVPGAGVGPVGLVGDVAGLEQDAQTAEAGVIAECIADLHVGDVLADHVAQRPVAVEVADLADEIRAPALAHAGLETVAFVVGGQAVYALGQARQHHVFAADAALRVGRRRDGDVAVVEARTGHHAETV